ncbi:MBL fold metallo-hydrolase [Novosphingobium pokkalii]|uniref:MBL fold metallo-hydrolase n=1 Tax=Novosphingobium pokkalii TaxID=1770194 RepID=UPI0036447046
MALAGCSGSSTPTGNAAAPTTAAADDATTNCKSGITLQLLGSGGPISDDARASSGAVVWIDGKARLLIDAGGGTFLRYGESGARLEDLDFIGISHFHTDHVADLPAILKGAYFLNGRHDVALAGPSSNANFPSMTAFFNRTFGQGRGAFEYLAGLSGGTDGLKLSVHPRTSTSPALSPPRSGRVMASPFPLWASRMAMCLRSPIASTHPRA